MINRSAKAFINTSDDSDLLVDAINRSTENEYEGERNEINPEYAAQKEIERDANQEVIDVKRNEPLKKQPEIIDFPQGKQVTKQPQNEETLQEDLFEDAPNGQGW